MLRHPWVSFATIQQGANEPCMSFNQRLQTAILRQVDNVDAQNVLTLQLAQENANQDGQKILASLKGQNLNIAEMIKAYQNVGTGSYNVKQDLKCSIKKCLKCKTGYPWDNQCRPRIDSQGNPNSGKLEEGFPRPKTNGNQASHIWNVNAKEWILK